MDRGAWPFFVRRFICLVLPVSVCIWKQKREEEETKTREKEKKMKHFNKRTRGKEKEKKSNKKNSKKKLRNQEKPPNELSHHDSKKKNRGTELFGIFFRKFRISPCFKQTNRFEFDFRAPRNEFGKQ